MTGPLNESYRDATQEDMGLVVTEHSTPQLLTISAIEDAFTRLPESATPEAKIRIVRGINNRLGPAIEESVIISEQLRSPEYQQYVKETNQFLNGRRIGQIVCPDGRILSYYALGDPMVMVFHQTLAGIPPVRPSTADNGPVLDDGSITGAVISGIKSRRKDFPEASMEERIGGHINSDEPINGCGAMKDIISQSQLPEFGMKFGGIDKFFSDLKNPEFKGDGFYVFDRLPEKIPDLKDIHSVTFDIVHDAYSQGIIFGLKNRYKEFDPNRSLRENLLEMHRRRKIIMTEELDHAFHQRIEELDAERFPGKGEIDPLDPTKLAENMIRIGSIARELTEAERELGFRFLPEELVKGFSEEDKLSLAYALLRNVVYRKLANIEPGAHALLEHNEEWIRIGYGGPLNQDHVAFVHRTPPGALRTEDIQRSQKLHLLLRGALGHKKVKPEDEAIVVVVGALFDPSRRATLEIAQEDREVVYSTVGNNAAIIRLKNKQDIENGAIVVIGAIFGPDGTITEIVR